MKTNDCLPKQLYHPINGGLALTAVEIFLLAP